MDTKYCPECGNLNILSAKFCMSCRAEFPNLQVIARTPVKPVKTSIPYEEEGLDPESLLTVEDGTSLASKFIDAFERAGIFNKIEAQKLGDVISTEKKDNKRSKRRPPAKMSARQILESTKETRVSDDV